MAFGFGFALPSRLAWGGARGLPIVIPAATRDYDLTGPALPADIVFTRASVGTYFDAAGVLQTAAVNAPRFDYDPMAHTARGLLIEEARTNLVPQSQDLDLAAWTKGGSSITPNAITAPDGTLTADFLVENAALSAHSVQPTPATAVTSGQSYSMSIFAKAGTRSILYMNLADAQFGASFSHAAFNLLTGECQSAGFGVAAMQNCGNGWWRCSWANVACILTGSSSVQYLMSATYPTPPTFAAATYQGDGVSGMYLWGAQFEVGASVSSYIPTVAAAVTRAVDTALISGAAFSAFWNQSEGTVAVVAASSDVNPASNPRIWYASDGTANNRLVLTRAQANSTATYIATVAGVTQASLTPPANAMPAGAFAAIASAYKLDNFGISANGGVVLTDMQGTVPTVDRVHIGVAQNGTSQLLNGTIKRFTYWNTRLSDAQLQALSAGQAPA